MIVISAKRLGLPALADSDFFFAQSEQKLFGTVQQGNFFLIYGKYEPRCKRKDSEARVMARPMHCRGSD